MNYAAPNPEPPAEPGLVADLMHDYIINHDILRRMLGAEREHGIGSVMVQLERAVTAEVEADSRRQRGM